MLSQLFGAVLRAVLVFFVVATPSLTLGHASRADADGIMLLGVIAALFVVFEYSARHPAIIEFRDAPPYNRLRILALFTILFVLSLLSADHGHLAQFHGPEGVFVDFAVKVDGFGHSLQQAPSQSANPAQFLPHLFGSTPVHITVTEHVVTMGILALSIALVFLAIFAVVMRLTKWPGRGVALNMWVNLPMFDPTVGSDVTHRLKCDARSNIIWGLGLPLILPAALGMMFAQTGITLTQNGQGLVWVVALWAFLPMCLLMRAMALLRLRHMIKSHQKRVIAALTPDERLALS